MHAGGQNKVKHTGTSDESELTASTDSKVRDCGTARHDGAAAAQHGESVKWLKCSYCDRYSFSTCVTSVLTSVRIS